MRLQSHSSEIGSPRYCMISCNLGAPEGAERRAWPWQWRGEARCATYASLCAFRSRTNRSRTVNFSFWNFSETSAPNVDVPLTSRVWKLSILAHAARARRSRTTRAARATPQECLIVPSTPPQLKLSVSQSRKLNLCMCSLSRTTGLQRGGLEIARDVHTMRGHICGGQMCGGQACVVRKKRCQTF